MIDTRYKVLLPEWLLEMRKGEADEFQRYVIRYIAKGRPEYKVKGVEGKFAICVRREIE